MPSRIQVRSRSHRRRIGAGVAAQTLNAVTRAFWGLGEVTGAGRADSFPNALTLSNVNNAAQIAGLGAGLGFATNFNGTSQFLARPGDDAALSFGGSSQSMQVSAFIRLAALGSFRRIISKYNFATNNREFQLDFDSGLNRFTFAVSGDGTLGQTTQVAANALGVPVAGTIYFLEGFLNHLTQQVGIRVDNVTDTVVAHTDGINDGNSPFTIGQRSSGGTFWSGDVDAVGVYDEVLTPANSSILFAAGAGKEPPF